MTIAMEIQSELLKCDPVLYKKENENKRKLLNVYIKIYVPHKIDTLAIVSILLPESYSLYNNYNFLVS